MHTIRKLLAGCSAAAVLAGAAGPAAAQITATPAATAYPVSLPAGPLDAALVALAAQTHTQLIYPPEMARGRTAPALAGRYTPEEALARLLGDAATVSRAGAKVLVLKPAAPAAADPRITPAEATDRPFAARGAPGAADGPVPAALPTSGAAPAQLSELTVTGSQIRGVGQGPSPLLVLGRDDLDRSGHATVAAALQALPQNFSGVSTEGTVTTGADPLGTNATYASSINLRGLGSDATLVLVNGRRLAGAGSKGDFADLSTLPTAAVERIEVLLDGASALYGSDAVGGVVNIILRRDFHGAETRALYGQGTAGEPWESMFAQTVGRRWTDGGFLLSYENHHRSALAAEARAFSASADLRPLGGTDRRQVFSHPGNIMRTDPATGTSVPAFAIPEGQNGQGLKPSDFLSGQVNLENQRAGSDVLPEQQRHSLYAAVDQAIGERLELSADARLGYRRFVLDLPAPSSLFTVNRNNPYFVSPTGATSHSIAYSFADELPPPRASGSAESLGLSAGGSLRLARDWRADGYLAFAQEIGESRSRGLVNSSYLSEALGTVADRPQTAFSTAKDGYFNPFTGVAGANSPGVLAFIGSGFTYARARDRVLSANLKADGTLLEGPGGPIRLAAGLQARRESFVRVGANFTSGTAPSPQRAVDVERAVSAAFAELRAPLVRAGEHAGLRRLELSLAGRVERYDDFGTTSNPKAGLLWSPAEGLTLRASYGRSFRAPALRELFDAEVYSPSLLPRGGQTVLTLILGGGNPALKPETATSWTVGLDAAPPAVPGLRLGLTWFHTAFEDRIDRPVNQSILTALSDPALASFVRHLSPATNAEDRAYIAGLLANPATNTSQGSFPPEAYGAVADGRYVNTAALTVSGLDAQASYAFQRERDRFELAANLSYLAQYEQQVTPTAAATDLAGRANYPVRLRTRLSADWRRDRLGTGVALNYVGGYEDAAGTRIAAQPTLDLQLRLAPAASGPAKGVAATLSVRNLFDRDPPFYDSPAGVGYDPANADPIGRFVSLQVSRAW